MGMIRAKYEFTLPRGYVDEDGVLHRRGEMRLATAADEILPMRDPRVHNNAEYFMVLVLSRVITSIGTVSSVDPSVIESLFVQDFVYLQSLYNRINRADGAKGSLTVKNEDGHTIIADEDGLLILSTRDGKQMLTLDQNKGSMSLVSAGKLEIKAETVTITGKTTIKGQSVSVEADNDLALKGKQTKLEGSSTKLSGQTAELTGAIVNVQSSSILTLKGSITRIN